jgi:hypothetical protein
MMKLTMSAAALIAVAAFVTLPASADHLGGGARVNAEGWKDNGGARDARFGVWVECPKAASGVGCDAGQLAWEKAHVGLAYFDNCARNGAATGASAKPAATNQRSTR